MKFIQPRYQNVAPVNVALSERTRKILHHYAQYTGLTESQVLEETLVGLLEDPAFIDHIERQRNNIRTKRELGIFDE